ncbi:MAG: PIN domain-containing protein [Candidatus Diapherotrites archaeon]|nr:PIN domain-containing protein [Candidatus Diapherotrites archaeon]
MTANEWGLVDSNILIYAFDSSEGQKHERAKRFLFERLDAHDACVSIQNLVEFHANATGRIQAPISMELSKTTLNKLSNTLMVIEYGFQTVLHAISYQQSKGVPFWDALLIATMEENSVGLIYTEDEKHFQGIPWLKVLNPLKG